MSERPPQDPYARVAVVESALAKELGDGRFHPHLVLHEYEAWIYSDPDRCADVLQDPARPDPTRAARLKSTRDSEGGPERIDESPASAPSKRLLKEFPGYQKTFHGPLAVGAVGLPSLRAACPHAHDWLSRLEGG